MIMIPCIARSPGTFYLVKSIAWATVKVKSNGIILIFLSPRNKLLFLNYNANNGRKNGHTLLYSQNTANPSVIDKESAAPYFIISPISNKRLLFPKQQPFISSSIQNNNSITESSHMHYTRGTETIKDRNQNTSILYQQVPSEWSSWPARPVLPCLKPD